MALTVNGQLSYKSAIIIDDVFLKDINELLCTYFEEPKYTADLINNDKVEFDSIMELLAYDNYSKNAIKALHITFGIGNRICIEPEMAFIRRYKSTIQVWFEVDSNDKSEEVKRKILLIFDKHKQSILYTLASKLTFMQIGIIILGICLMIMVHELRSPQKELPLVLKAQDVTIMYVGAALGAILSIVVNWVVGKCFPSVVFYLGDNIKVIEKKSKIKGNVFWGVLVAAIVSAFVSWIFS